MLAVTVHGGGLGENSVRPQLNRRNAAPSAEGIQIVAVRSLATAYSPNTPQFGRILSVSRASYPSGWAESRPGMSLATANIIEAFTRIFSKLPARLTADGPWKNDLG